MVDQDYSGYVRKVDFTTLPTVTVDSAADYIVVLDATDGLLKKGLPPSGGGTNIRVDDAGVLVSTRPEINFIEAGNITITVADNPGSTRADITIASYDTAAIDAIGTTTPATDALPYYDSASSAATTTLTSFARTILDDTTAAAARTTLGVVNGEVLFSDTPNATTSIASVTAVELVNKSITFAAGDVVDVEMWGTLLNDSGTTRTYTPSMVMAVGANTLTLTCTDGATVGASATNRAYWRVRGLFTVTSTGATQGMMESDRAPGAAANTVQSIAATTNRKVWNTTASDMVGSGTIAVRFQSNNATATQQFTVYGYQIRQQATRT